MRTHKWAEIEAKMAPERLAEIKRRADIMLAAMDLQDLLSDRGITQEELARQMEIGQGNVSRMLRRANMNINTLQDAIEAMGGKLEIIAHFPDKDYRIDQFATT
jgi:DNA-binding Xre family transcriptional regulator